MNKLVSIQYVRALAALLVVFHHIRNPAPWLWNPFSDTEFGNAGVMVFFVVSGFVMHASCRGGSVGTFLWRRFVRIVPFYWVMTTAAFAFITLRAMSGGNVGIEWSHYVQSLAFIPHFSPRHPDFIWPVLIPGWTLNCEVFFFLLFAAGMAFGRASTMAVLAILMLVVSGQALHPSSAIAVTYTSHLMILFGIGIGIGALREHMDFGRLKVLAPLGLAGLTLAAFKVSGADHDILFFVSSAALVAGALAWESSLRRRPLLTVELAGDASYSIYLTHPFVYPPVLAILSHVPLTGPAQLVFVCIVTALVCTAVGVAVHVAVEKRLLAAFTRIPARTPRRG